MEDTDRWAMFCAYLYESISNLKSAENYMTAGHYDAFGDEFAAIVARLEEIEEEFA